MKSWQQNPRIAKRLEEKGRIVYTPVWTNKSIQVNRLMPSISLPLSTSEGMYCWDNCDGNVVSEGTSEQLPIVRVKETRHPARSTISKLQIPSSVLHWVAMCKSLVPKVVNFSLGQLFEYFLNLIPHIVFSHPQSSVRLKHARCLCRIWTCIFYTPLYIDIGRSCYGLGVFGLVWWALAESRAPGSGAVSALISIICIGHEAARGRARPVHT